MRYVMLICGTEKGAAAPAEAEEHAAHAPDEGMDAVYAWFEQWGAKGKIADGGAELQHSHTARTLRGSSDGPVVTDGPFVETKEVIGGVVMLECDSLDEAVDVAATWPELHRDGVSVEVRPTIPH
jgi:hypothetical protein